LIFVVRGNSWLTQRMQAVYEKEDGKTGLWSGGEQLADTTS